MELRTLTLVSLVYVINYVIVLFIVHSPLSGGHENVVNLLGDTYFHTGANTSSQVMAKLSTT